MSLLSRLAGCLFAAVLAFAGPARANDADDALDTAIDKTFAMSKAGDPGASDFLARSLREAEAKGASDKGLVAEGYFYLGRFQSKDNGKLAQAEETLRKAIEMLNKAPEGGDVGMRIDSLVLLGQVVGRQQRPDNALAVFYRAAQLQAQNKGRTSRDRIDTLLYMAITYEAAGQLRPAEYYRRTALGMAIDTKLLADDIAYWRKALADNLDKQNRKADATKVRNGERVIDLEGVMFDAIVMGQKLITDGKAEEARAHFLKLKKDFASAADSPLYMLILKDVAETADQTNHAGVAAIYEEAAATEERMLGITPVEPLEFQYLAAREWAFDGKFERASRSFEELDKFGNSVGRDVTERQRAIRTIMAAALAQQGDSAACRKPVNLPRTDEIFYAGYAIERVMADLGRNASRAPALECAMHLGGTKGSDQAVFATIMALGLAQVETGDYERAADTLDEVLAAAERMNRPADEKRSILTFIALADGWTRKFDEALKLLDRAEALPGASDVDVLSLLRVRAIVYINATRYLDAEATVNKALAQAERIKASSFDDNRAGALNDLASVLVRAGRTADAFRLIERIGLPKALPANASPSTFLFYIDIAENRMTLLAALDRIKEAQAAAEVFRTVALPAADRLLADADRNSIMAATVAATLNQAALTLVRLGRFDEAAAVADKAATLIAADRSPGVRLVGARVELVGAMAMFNGGDANRALPRFDRAYAQAERIVPAESDEIYEIVAGRGMARLALGQGAAALADLRAASSIARARIGRENRFNDQGTQRTVRPAFTALVGAAWQAAH